MVNWGRFLAAGHIGLFSKIIGAKGSAGLGDEPYVRVTSPSGYACASVLFVVLYKEN